MPHHHFQQIVMKDNLSKRPGQYVVSLKRTATVIATGNWILRKNVRIPAIVAS